MTLQSGSPRALRDIEPTPEMRRGTELIKLEFEGGDSVFLYWHDEHWVVHMSFMPMSMGYLCAQLGSRVVVAEGRTPVKEPVIFSFGGVSAIVVSQAPLHRIATYHFTNAHRTSLTLHNM